MKITTNPNKQYVEEIRRRLKENDGYCPCKLEKTPDNKCICKEFLEADNGSCHCGLYVKTTD